MTLQDALRSGRAQAGVRLRDFGDPLAEPPARPGGRGSAHDRDRRPPADDHEEVS